jgi:hypothetical protein
LRTLSSAGLSKTRDQTQLECHAALLLLSLHRSPYYKLQLTHTCLVLAQIPSDNVPFNQAPDMKAREITGAAMEALKIGKYSMIRVNYANPDMVGLSGW